MVDSSHLHDHGVCEFTYCLYTATVKNVSGVVCDIPWHSAPMYFSGQEHV